ncbi:MAG: sensor histidine kinase [Bacteroidota bacterium]
MGITFLTIAFLGYFLLLFIIAFYAEKRGRSKKSIVNNPYIYALSLAVYCTAWTDFGSIGRAATDGYGFLPIYLGPTILAPLWIFFLVKIIRISKAQRINSIADFISARYGKSTLLGVIAAFIAIFSIIPYISIQLKGIVFCLDILSDQTGKEYQDIPFFEDSALYISIALAVFAILFGTRNVDPNERHEGLVAAIAFESVFKLIAFLAAGIFIVFGIYGGFDQLFSQAYAEPKIAAILDFSQSGIEGGSWFFLLLLSGLAIIFLPRQFHVAVVENTDAGFVKKAAWLFPLYLLLINFFVLPIATAGLLHYNGGMVDPDTFILQLPLDYGHSYLALFIALGGVSAGASMVIIAVTALTIMFSNNLLMPLLIRSRQMRSPYLKEFHKSLLGIRRVGVFMILLMAYGYYKSIGQQYTIVSIGLISFVAVAQFAPAIIGGIYWKRATEVGAAAGMIGGFTVWAITLPVLNLIEVGILPQSIMTEGIWGLSFLKPQSLFGLEMPDQISHSAFWSLLINTGLYFFASLAGRPSTEEITQADYFVNFFKYQKEGLEYEIIQREANLESLQSLLVRYLGAEKVKKEMRDFERRYKLKTSNMTLAPTELVNFLETSLAGALGAASAKIVINSIVKEKPISFEEMLKVLDQTQEVIQYSRQLEISRAELEAATLKLRTANEQLKELDEMKAEFISTVTHELRTPITSIKSLATIISSNPDLETAEKNRFLDIIVRESERLARMVNHVLDIEKLQDQKDRNFEKTAVNLWERVEEVLSSIEKSAEAKGIHLVFSPQKESYPIFGNRDYLIQIIINLLSNAMKFCAKKEGKITVDLSDTETHVQLSVADNGMGIEAGKQALIFEKFTQIQNDQTGKPDGSGLGLFITKKLVEMHEGAIWVESQPGKGAVFFIKFPKGQPSMPISK